jgi:tetratricopeptide (TPR) repeat protein
VRTWPLSCLLAIACAPKPAPEEPDETASRPTPADPVEHAQQLLQDGKPDEALAVLDRALVVEPDDPELHYGRGVVLAAKGDGAGARAAYETSVQADAKFVPGLVALAALDLDGGDPKAAETRLRAVLAIKDDFADAHANLSVALLRQGKTDEAVAELEVAHRLAPEDVHVLVELAQRYAESGRHDEALALTTRAVELRPDDAAAQAAHGWRLAQAGRHADAAAAFEASLRTRPGVPEVRLGLVRAWLRSDKAEAAAAEVEKLAAELPDSAPVQIEWATALAKLGKLPDAIARLDRAIELEPKSISAHVRRIGMLVEADRCKEAKAGRKTLVGMKADAAALAAADRALTGCRK